MLVNHFNNNINLLHNKAYYYELLKNKTLKIILDYKKNNNKTILDNNYFKIKNILNFIFYSYFLRQLGMTISKFDDKCITIKYLEYELNLHIYTYDYDKTIKNLKFECAKYSISEKIQKYLNLCLDENWDLIIYFIENNAKTTCLEENLTIPNTLEVALN